VSAARLEATAPVAFLDYFRIPYDVVADGGSARIRCHGRTFSWPEAAGTPRAATVAGIPVHARVLEEDAVLAALRGGGREWHATTPVCADGRRIGSVWRADDGSTFLPFDPDEAIGNAWSEQYLPVSDGAVARRAVRLAARAYYAAKPLLPRAAQIALRRRAAPLQARRRFPRWPVEPALHDLYDLLLAFVGAVAGEPVPWIAPWPDGHTWALVLTHDVETQAGYRALGQLRDVELAHGYRSSWNFVPRRYDVDDEVVRELADDGFEIGVHGLHHDGLDVSCERVLEERLPEMRAYAERWGAAGFRSPATNRVWRLMPRLGFDYDSSYPDTDPFEPQAGGCCSWLPYLNEGMVELPITLPQDHTLFVILRRHDGTLWHRKTRYLRSRGGMALLLTHPDYMGDAESLRIYSDYLGEYADDPTAWRALPREVAAWWRRRAASRLVPDEDDGWRVEGPAAAAAAVCFTPGPQPVLREEVAA
jgi:peptidoglycan/xylan/chitin deacetylase (PgdA/CDA1 family)